MEFSLRLSVFLLKLLEWFLSPLSFILKCRNGRKVPPISSKILYFSATKLAEKIRKRELKCEEVIRTYITRIKEVNVLINAVVEDRFADALEDAKAVDKLLNSMNFDEKSIMDAKPLLGVPVTIKESCSLKGMSHVVGSKVREGIRALDDGNAVALLKKAGAIPLLISNTPEYCLFWETNNLITGCTKNPYNINYSAAGSSGGEGALLGAAASVIGIGSDVAGSIRLPAHFNGVFGHKPTPKLVPTNGHFPMSYDQLTEISMAIGPLVRFAEDLPLMMTVLSGNPNNLIYDIDLRNINVFYVHEFERSRSSTRVRNDIKILIDQSVQHMKNVCYSNIIDCKFNFVNSLEISTLFYGVDDFPSILQYKEDKSNLLLEIFKTFICSPRHSWNGLMFSVLKSLNGCVLKSRHSKYEEELEILRKDLLVKLNDNGVIICPTFPVPAFLHNHFIFNISGIQYLSIFNLLGFPCTHIPMGLDKNHLPIGIQVVAAPNQDRLCFAVAREMEKAFGGWTPSYN